MCLPNVDLSMCLNNRGSVILGASFECAPLQNRSLAHIRLGASHALQQHTFTSLRTSLHRIEPRAIRRKVRRHTMSHLAAQAFTTAGRIAPLAMVAAHFLGAPLSVTVLTAAAAVGTMFCAALAVADADLRLLSLGGHEKNRFRGKRVVIVGASSGIGAALAEYLAKQGAILVLSSRGTEQLKVVRDACQKHNGRAQETHVVPVDVTAPADALATYVAAACTVVGQVDYLVLAAGASQSAVVEETTMATAQQIMEINATGNMNVARAWLPCLLAQGFGRIVPVASMASRVASPGQAEYAAAKHALLGYFSSVASEVAARGVGVSVVCPGPIAGAEVRSVFGAQGRVNKQEDDSGQKKKVPVERCCELICSAAAHGVQEAWIAKHPVLFMGYLQQYLPAVAQHVLQKIGPKRARALREGKSGYSYSLAQSKAD